MNTDNCAAVYQTDFNCMVGKEKDVTAVTAAIVIRSSEVCIEVTRTGPEDGPALCAEQLSFIDAWHVMQYLPHAIRLRAVTLRDLVAAVKGELHDTNRRTWLSHDLGMQPDDLLVSVWGITCACRSAVALQEVLNRQPQHVRVRLVADIQQAVDRGRAGGMELIHILDDAESQTWVPSELSVAHLPQEIQSKKGLFRRFGFRVGAR